MNEQLLKLEKVNINSMVCLILQKISWGSPVKMHANIALISLTSNSFLIQFKTKYLCLLDTLVCRLRRGCPLVTDCVLLPHLLCRISRIILHVLTRNVSNRPECPHILNRITEIDRQEQPQMPGAISWQENKNFFF